MSSSAGLETATASGAASRLELVTWAILAEFVYLGVALVPLLPLVLLQAVFYGPVVALLCLAVFGLVVWWLIQAGAWEPPGDAPAAETPLYAVVESMCRQMNAPRIHRIVLDDELNASAYQSRGLFSVLGVRRTLVLGIPLLFVLSEKEARGVIAHELAHFSRDHGRLGHWIYAVRSKWDQYLFGARGEHDFLDTVLRAIAARFVPFFLSRSHRWSRACEFEADALASQCEGPQALATGLVRLQVLDHIAAEALPGELQALRLREAQAPGDFWKRFRDLAAGASQSHFEPALHLSRTRPGRLHDTHPRLEERLAALRTPAQPPQWDNAPSAGDVLLGPSWASVLAACEQRWQARASWHWKLDHIRLRWLAARLAPAASEQLGDIERATAQEELSPSPETLRRLQDLAAAGRQQPALLYHLGKALLERGKREGCDHIRQAIRSDKRLAPAGRRAMHAFFERHGTDAEVQASSEQLRRASERLEFLQRDLWRQLVQEPVQALGAHQRQVLAETVHTDRFLDACWAVRTRMAGPDGTEYEVNVLVVRLEPGALTAAGLSEDEVGRMYQAFLDAVCPPDQVARVHTVFTTEPLNPHLHARLQATPDACIRAPTVPLNADMLKFDSL